MVRSRIFLWLVVLLALATVVAIRLSTPDQPPDPRSLWDRVLASLVGLLPCFGLVIGASVLVALTEVLKRAASRCRPKQAEKGPAPDSSFNAIRQSLHDLGLQLRVERGSWRLSRPGSHEELVLSAPREGEVLSLDQLRRMLEEGGLLREDEDQPGG